MSAEKLMKQVNKVQWAAYFLSQRWATSNYLPNDRSQKPLIGWGIFTRTRAHNVDRWLTAGIRSAQRSEKSSENKKCEVERAIEWYFELLLIFAWPLRQNLCSFINGNLRRKIGLLKNSMKLMDCGCLPTTSTIFGFCFGLGTLEGSLDSFPLKFENAP